MSFTFERYIKTGRPKKGKPRRSIAAIDSALDSACRRIPTYKLPPFDGDLRPDYLPQPQLEDWPELFPPLSYTRLGSRVKEAIKEFEASKGCEASVVYMTREAAARLREAVISVPIAIRPELTCPFLVG